MICLLLMEKLSSQWMVLSTITYWQWYKWLSNIPAVGNIFDHQNNTKEDKWDKDDMKKLRSITEKLLDLSLPGMSSASGPSQLLACNRWMLRLLVRGGTFMSLLSPIWTSISWGALTRSSPQRSLILLLLFLIFSVALTSGVSSLFLSLSQQVPLVVVW